MNRRELLKMFGMASGLACPMLRSPLALAQSAGRAPVRTLFVLLDHGWGIDPGYESFTGSETDFRIPTIWQPLNALKDKSVFIDGLRLAQWGNAHHVGATDALTASVAEGEASSNSLGRNRPEPLGPSIDWLLGQRLNTQVLRLSQSDNIGYCFNGNRQKQAAFDSSLEAYNSIIRPLQQRSPSTQPQDSSFQQSLLSLLGADANRLMDNLPSSQSRKIESYIEGLDELSRKIVPPAPAGQIDPISSVPGRGDSGDREVDHFFEFMKLGFQAGTHNVGVLTLSTNPRNMSDVSWVDSRGRRRNSINRGSDYQGYHQDVAHYSRSKTNSREMYTGIVQSRLQKVVNFAQTLERMRDFDGRTILDNTMIVLVGGMGNGNHSRRRATFSVIGGGGGNIRTGRLIRVGRIGNTKEGGSGVLAQRRNGQVVDITRNYGGDYGNRTASDFFVAIARAAGVNINRFGMNCYNTTPIPL